VKLYELVARWESAQAEADGLGYELRCGADAFALLGALRSNRKYRLDLPTIEACEAAVAAIAFDRKRRGPND
jgi:hypothetical protein